MTDETPPGAPKRNPLAEQAADWFAKMRGPEAETHRPTFEAWLARGALHLRAYNRAVEIFSDGKFLDGSEGLDPRSPVAPSTASDGPARSLWSSFLLPVTILAVGAIMIIGWAVLAKSGKERLGLDRGSIASERNNQSSETRYSTRIGEVRTEKLADGSSVTLQSNSLLLVLFDERHRDLRLERGRGRFDVAHEARPFIVYAGGGSVTARGTVFDVNVGADRHVTVRLERGVVDVVLPTSRDRAPPFKRLEPGQAVTFDVAPASPTATAIAPRLSDPISPAQTTNMPVIREFYRVRLADLIAEANRNAKVHIRLADAALGERTVSGRFRINDAAKLANRLATIFDLRIDQSSSSEIVLGAR